MLKNKKGITLVALVVTVIVLIILAAVTINLLIGSNGIITRVQEGRENYTRAEQNEQAGLLGLAKEMDKLTFNLPPIPEGFRHTEGTVEEGYVIEGPDGSEFVWVPVPYAVSNVDIAGKTEEQIAAAINDEEMANEKYPMAIKLEDGNYRGVFYDFAGRTSVTITVMVNGISCREPDIIDGDTDSNLLTYGIGVTRSTI